MKCASSGKGVINKINGGITKMEAIKKSYEFWKKEYMEGKRDRKTVFNYGVFCRLYDACAE